MDPKDAARDLPMGFGMALAQNMGAMERFSALSAQEQQQLLDRAGSVRSKAEMQALVSSIAPGGTFF